MSKDRVNGLAGSSTRIAPSSPLYLWAPEVAPSMSPNSGTFGDAHVAACRPATPPPSRTYRVNPSIARIIVEHIPLKLIEEDGVERFDLGIVEVLEVVTEHGREGPCVFAHQLQRQISERRRAMVEAAVVRKVQNQERSRLPWLRRAFMRNGRRDSLPQLGGHLFRRRNLRQARELIDVLPDRSTYGSIEGIREACQLPQRLDAATRLERDEQRTQLLFGATAVMSGCRWIIRRRHRRLLPAQLGQGGLGNFAGDRHGLRTGSSDRNSRRWNLEPYPGASVLERRDSRFRVAGDNGDAQIQIGGESVQIGKYRRLCGYDDQRSAQRLAECKRFLPLGWVRRQREKPICRDSQAQCVESRQDRVYIPGRQVLIETLLNAGTDPLTADRLHECETGCVRDCERLDERRRAKRVGARAEPPAEDVGHQRTAAPRVGLANGNRWKHEWVAWSASAHRRLRHNRPYAEQSGDRDRPDESPAMYFHACRSRYHDGAVPCEPRHSSGALRYSAGS